MPRLFRMTLAVIFLLCLFVLTESGPSLRHQPIALAQGGEVATISGRVTDDLDGWPMVGVSIILIDPDTPETQIVAAVTDFEGRYTATQVISNTWVIRFDPSTSTLAGYVLPEYYDDTFDFDTATLVTVEAGTETTGIDAGLAQVGQVTGRVIADDSGAPLEYVRVSALDSQNGTSNIVFTDATGHFTMAIQSETGQKLRFDPLDQSGYALEFYNNHTSPGDAPLVTVPEGRTRHVEVGLGPGAIITGMVTSSWRNRPLAAPVVFALNERGEEIQIGGRYGDNPNQYEALYPPGYYTLPNMPPGTYEFRFEAQNHRRFSYTTFVDVAEGEKVTDINANLVVIPRVTSIATTAGDPNTILMTVPFDGVPVVTTDGGMNWQPIANPTWLVDPTPWASPDTAVWAKHTAALAPRGAPGEGIRLLVNVGLYPGYLNALRPGQYRSGDNGQSWADAPVDPPLDTESCSETDYSTPVTTVRAPGHLYMLHRCSYIDVIRLLISDNNGVTWRDVTTVEGRTLLLYYGAVIVPSPLVDGLIYVHDGREQWYRSRNNGVDWETVNFPVQSLTLDAEDANTLYGWSPLHGSPWTRTPMRSKDGGASWQEWAASPCPYGFAGDPPQTVAHPLDGGALLVRCENNVTNGIYRSTDGGDSWQKVANAIGVLLVADMGVPGRFLWAKDDGLWATTNNGDTWHPIMQNYRVNSTMLYIPSVAGAP